MWTIYFAYFGKNVVEGGSSRTKQFAEFMQKSGVKSLHYHAKNKILRFFHGVLFFLRTVFYRNEKIFFHFSLFTYFFTSRGAANKHILKFLSAWLQFVSKKNQLTIEVNDLMYEQALDLDLPKNSLWRTQELVFSAPGVRFIFAAREMMLFAVKKYGADPVMCSYIINGGLTPQYYSNNFVFNDDNRIRFVYAGSLNRGRQIEELIRLFSDGPCVLYLMGGGGEWLHDFEFNEKNIFFLGELAEIDAHQITSQCDCGIIPYADDRLYYNICFPTKASFYITAGIPFLATPLRELMFHFDGNLVFFRAIADWRELMINSNLADWIKARKKRVLSLSEHFFWSSVLARLNSLVKN